MLLKRIYFPFFIQFLPKFWIEFRNEVVGGFSWWFENANQPLGTFRYAENDVEVAESLHLEDVRLDRIPFLNPFQTLRVGRPDADNVGKIGIGCQFQEAGGSGFGHAARFGRFLDLLFGDALFRQCGNTGLGDLRAFGDRLAADRLEFLGGVEVEGKLCRRAHGHLGPSQQFCQRLAVPIGELLGEVGNLLAELPDLLNQTGAFGGLGQCVAGIGYDREQRQPGTQQIAVFQAHEQADGVGDRRRVEDAGHIERRLGERLLQLGLGLGQFLPVLLILE
ncbi:hypothetical protein [Azospirillum brasilense]|uniref:hypothetical protein n=1 Tax=Azospirillum brasilense TaxID=192 RepID=UPI000E0C2F58|nr:hypothetical protein [Azospirillum brasilense]